MAPAERGPWLGAQPWRSRVARRYGGARTPGGAEEAAPSSGHPPGEQGIDYAAPGSETTRVPTHRSWRVRPEGPARSEIQSAVTSAITSTRRIGTSRPRMAGGSTYVGFLASSRMAIWPRVASRPSRPTALRPRARLPGVRPRAAATIAWMPSPKAVGNSSQGGDSPNAPRRRRGQTRARRRRPPRPAASTAPPARELGGPRPRRVYARATSGSPTACRSASALSVRSHVKSGSSRPK